MVQQTVYGVTNDYNALAINTVNHLECEVKIFYHQFAPTIGSPFLVQPCFGESLSQAENLQTFEHSICFFQHSIFTERGMIPHGGLIEFVDFNSYSGADYDFHGWIDSVHG